MKYRSDDMTCAGCDYFQHGPQDRFFDGTCRRHPPVRFHDVEGVHHPTMWPRVDGKTGWCGEYFYADGGVSMVGSKAYLLELLEEIVTGLDITAPNT